MPEFDGRVALVTGSSRGIGAAIARLFARAGAAVAVHGRDEARRQCRGLTAVRIRANCIAPETILTERNEASDGAGWITGVVLDVAGGAVMV